MITPGRKNDKKKTTAERESAHWTDVSVEDSAERVVEKKKNSRVLENKVMYKCS